MATFPFPAPHQAEPTRARESACQSHRALRLPVRYVHASCPGLLLTSRPWRAREHERNGQLVYYHNAAVAICNQRRPQGQRLVGSKFCSCLRDPVDHPWTPWCGRLLMRITCALAPIAPLILEKEAPNGDLVTHIPAVSVLAAVTALYNCSQYSLPVVRLALARSLKLLAPQTLQHADTSLLPEVVYGADIASARDSITIAKSGRSR